MRDRIILAVVILVAVVALGLAAQTEKDCYAGDCAVESNE